MGMPELEVHPDDLSQVVGVLRSAGGELFGHASDLAAAPDAGRSTGEVGKALAALGTAVAALSEELGGLAEGTGAASALLTGTDDVVGARLGDGLGGGLVGP